VLVGWLLLAMSNVMLLGSVEKRENLYFSLCAGWRRKKSESKPKGKS